jgi:hypothetical protein
MHNTAFTLQRGGEEINLDIDYAVTPFFAGRRYGLPEDCEPPSGGEVEELEVFHDGQPFALAPKEVEQIERHICETHDFY